MMELYNPYIVPRHEAPPNADNHSEDIIYTDPNDVPMYVTLTPVQLAALPHPNYASRLLVALWVLLLPATILLALRLYLKLSRHRGIWWDDWILIGAWGCVVAECSCLSYAVTIGYGKYWYDWSQHPTDKRDMILMIYAAGSLTFVAAIWSKTSFALTLLRLTEGWVKWAIWFIIVSMNVFMGLSAMFNWIQCAPIDKMWYPDKDGACWDPEIVPNYNLFSGAYSAAMDLTLAFLPWTIIWGLQMRRKEKIGVAIAMSCGVFAGITAIVKTSKMPAMKSPNPSPAIDLYIWGNVESCITIVAACIPILRVFVRDLKTSAERYYLSGGHTAATATHRHTLRDNVNTVTITAGRHDDISSHGDEDERGLTKDANGRIMQTKEVAIEYQDNRDGWTDEHEMDDLRQRSNRSF